MLVLKGNWFEVKTVDIMSYTFTELSLSTGARYYTRVAAVNGASLLATYDTNGIRIDTTPPYVSKLNVIK